MQCQSMLTTQYNIFSCIIQVFIIIMASIFNTDDLIVCILATPNLMQ